MTVNQSCFPLAYFRRLEDNNPSKIAEAHKLAWNMGQAPLLFLVLPGRALVYSTYESPRLSRKDGSLDDKAGLIETIDLVTNAGRARQRMREYSRAELLSGRFWERPDTRKHFGPNARVERTLLDNLSDIRSQFIEEHLDAPTVHSLLGRAIFIQYLQDRKDSKGHSAFPQGYFERLLSGASSFPDVLSSKAKTYDLFDELGERFNGDIFPVTPAERDCVKQEHLDRLARFLQGRIDLPKKQLLLWSFYSFDAIPIEFISNMYEAFFHYEEEEKEVAEGKRKKKDAKGTYYTRQRLVDFILDEVLPWEGKEPKDTQVRILDPACGSGIFLVQAYRRLIARWQQANPDKRIDAPALKKLLTRNLYGVDSNPEAIRVAAFSLCLTMCDYLEPRHVWERVKFPSLRDKNLRHQDFFEFAGTPSGDAGSFDLVVGNPPWESELSRHAADYLQNRGRKVGDKQIAQAFLWAAPEFCKDSGKVCLIAPGKGLLFNASEPNKAFRKEFLKAFKVNLIVNFAALRKDLFPTAVGPAATVLYERTPPGDDHRIVYCCPKPSNSPEDGWHYVIENHDLCHIPWQDAAEDPLIWKTAMWGGPRDWDLVKKLGALPNLRKIVDERGWIDGEGFILGDREKDHIDPVTGKVYKGPADWLTGKPCVSPDALRLFCLNEKALPTLSETLFHRPRPRRQEIFTGPHLLVKQSPTAGKRFIAALVKKEAVFNHSLLGIAGPMKDEELLGAVCAAFATEILAYFAMMTSSRWLVERDELDKHEIMKLPIPEGVKNGDLRVSYSDLQAAAREEHSREKLVDLISKAYRLSSAERVLIHDAVTYTLDYFRLGDNSDAVKPADEHMLKTYARRLCQVLEKSFGTEKGTRFPAKIHLGDNPMVVLEVVLTPKEGRQAPKICRADGQLSEALKTMDGVLLDKWSSGVYVRRDVHVYRDGKLFVAKRNQCRLWTESAAMREADEVYGEIMRAWGQQAWR